MKPARERIFNVPLAVIAVLALLGLVHAVFVLALSQRETTEFLLLFAFIPARFDSSLLPDGVLPGGRGAQIWSFVTYALIHADLNHLIFNAVWLLAFGTPLARRFGSLRFAAFLMVTAAAGAVAHLVTHIGEMAPMIGASAAVSGTMAAAMRFAFEPGGPLGPAQRRAEDLYHVPAPSLGANLRNPRALAFLLVWFGLNALFGAGSLPMPGIEQSIAWQAHIGGFLAGLITFSLFDPVPKSTESGSPDESE